MYSDFVPEGYHASELDRHDLVEAFSIEEVGRIRELAATLDLQQSSIGGAQRVDGEGGSRKQPHRVARTLDAASQCIALSASTVIVLASNQKLLALRAWRHGRTVTIFTLRGARRWLRLASGHRVEH